LHDLTTRLTQEFDLIFIEDLNVKALSRGRNARSIQDASFGEIRRQLTYKSEWHDKILIAVDRWYASSKTCSKCRHVLDELRLDVRFWTCPKCKACHDRDINAARNLLMEGLRQLAARDERDLCVDAGDAGCCDPAIPGDRRLTQEPRLKYTIRVPADHENAYTHCPVRERPVIEFHETYRLRPHRLRGFRLGFGLHGHERELWPQQRC
jgi:IS605 OrfB family transposase